MSDWRGLGGFASEEQGQRDPLAAAQIRCIHQGIVDTHPIAPEVPDSHGELPAGFSIETALVCALKEIRDADQGLDFTASPEDHPEIGVEFGG